MAARRDRERRRPAQERRYQFGSRQAESPDAELDEAQTSVATVAEPVRADPRAAPRPAFSTYKAEYSYVLGDLRRVAMVIGGLLLFLIVLYFFLPH
jgi:hypothetical protein